MTNWIDTEELHTRLEELRDMRADEDEPDLTDEEEDELNELEEIENVCSGFQYGETMILERDFEDYARDLHKDLTGHDTDEWPYTCIDWSEAADQLKDDYSEVEYQGRTYYVRSY